MAAIRCVWHADDLGMNAAVNSGIFTAFESGILTSTSLLANGPAAEAGLRQWKRLREAGSPAGRIGREIEPDVQPFDLGVHLNLSQGRPLTGDCYPPSLCDSNGRFPGIGKVAQRLLLAADTATLTAIEAEFRAQIAFLVDHGIQPTHVNGHQYVEMLPALSRRLIELLRHFGIDTVRVARESGLFRSKLILDRSPVGWGLALVKRLFAERHSTAMRRAGFKTAAGYFGTAHAGTIGLRTLQCYLSSMRAGRTYEIGCHPATPHVATETEIADGWFDPLAQQRPGELALLTSPETVKVLATAGVELSRLSSYRD